MQSTVTFIGYKKESLFPILEYLVDNGNNQQLVTLDVDEFFFGRDLIFDTLKISNLHINNDKDGYIHTASFTCTSHVAKNLLKLFYYIKQLGDGGHSYTIKINKEKFSWDGDGSDRIIKINGQDCKSWKQMEKNFTIYLKKEDSLNEEYIIENSYRIE